MTEAGRAAPVSDEGRLEVENGYQIAYRIFGMYCRHLWRSSSSDKETARREFAEVSRRFLEDTGPAYALWGPHEFRGSGPQAYFDISHRLGEISVPALILCGWYDELSPERCSRPLADGIADNEYVIFGNSSHLTILEKEGDSYLAVIRDFLRRRVLQAGS